VHNALDEDFLRRAIASRYAHLPGGRFTVLMLASLRRYKGVPEFLALAASLAAEERIRFDLVLNESPETVERYRAERLLPANVALHPRTDDTARFYERASLVLNLSRPDQWVETFGMTILEALAFGVPVIAPPIGGPPELVRDGVEGFLVDSRDGARVRARVLELFGSASLASRMSAAGRARAAAFAPARFSTDIARVIASAKTGAGPAGGVDGPP
jgi:glycosyltransferase involved in cell wall biosynthesis